MAQQQEGQPYEADEPRRQLQSVVAPVEEGHRHAAASGGKRTAGELLEDKPDIKRRNKRLFGAILGTLQRFNREEEEAQKTAAAQRRAELLQKAEEKKAEESRKLRQLARDEVRQMREGEIARKREMSAQAACKRLEVLYATKLARADKLSSHFLLTTTTPPLYYCPGKPCKELEQLADKQQEVHLAWKEQQLQQLEEEKEQLKNQLTQRRSWGGQQQQQQRHGEEAPGDGGAEMEDDEHVQGRGQSPGLLPAEAAGPMGAAGPIEAEQQQSDETGEEAEGADHMHASQAAEEATQEEEENLRDCGM